MVMVSKAAAPPSSIAHPAHPAHVLQLVATGGALFQCDGCRHYGDDERRYRCAPCDFDLHVCCATMEPQLAHPFFEGARLTFLHSPPSAPAGCGRFCDACGDQVLGFVLNDGERQIDLHPQCASQPERVVSDDSKFDLCKEAPARGSCVVCGHGQDDARRSRYWCYRYLDGDGETTYMHLACLMGACYTRFQFQVAKVSAPTTQDVECAPIRRSGSRFSRFCKVASKVAEITLAVATLDPVGVVTAVADL